MADEPVPYPLPRKGERFRWLDFPCERPEQADVEPLTATRRDGTRCDIRRSLGLPSVPALDGDMGVRWTAWPP